jgi:hypothetical protein
VSGLFPVLQILFPTDWREGRASTGPAEGWRLLLCALSLKDAAEFALSERASVLALVDEEREHVALFDDAGNETPHSCGLPFDGGPSDAFLLGEEGPWTWGLSTGRDILFPEHARALAAAGMDVLCVLPGRVEERSALPLDVLARARALENQIYVVLLSPEGEESLFVGPGGLPIPLVEERGFPTAMVERSAVASARKALPLLDFARKSPLAGLAKR